MFEEYGNSKKPEMTAFRTECRGFDPGFARKSPSSAPKSRAILQNALTGQSRSRVERVAKAESETLSGLRARVELSRASRKNADAGARKIFSIFSRLPVAFSKKPVIISFAVSKEK
jgi:hypothetical protein